MKKTVLFISSMLCLATLIFYLIASLSHVIEPEEQNSHEASGAGQALDMWAWERMFPESKINTQKYVEAFKSKAEGCKTQWEKFR